MILSNKTTKTYFSILCSMLLSCTGPSIFSLVAKNIYPVLGIMYFLIIGGFSMLIVSAWEAKKGTQETHCLINTTTALKIIVVGVIAALNYISYVYAMKSHSVTLTVLIVRVGPLFTVLLSSFFLQERVKNWYKILLAALFCLIGIGFMSHVKPSTLLAFEIEPFILLAVAAAFFGALKNVIERDIQSKNEQGLSDSFMAGATMLIGGFVTTLWMLFANKSFFALPKFDIFFMLLWLGIGTVAIPSIISLKAYRVFNGVSKVAFTDYFRPLISLIYIEIFIGHEQNLNFIRVFVGFILISIGVYIINQNIAKKDT